MPSRPGLCYCGSGVEQLTRNEQVVGSNPTSSSNIKKRLHNVKPLFILGDNGSDFNRKDNIKHGISATYIQAREIFGNVYIK